MTLFNIARMKTSTTGTGTLTLTTSANGFLTFQAAGVSNNATISYGIEDGDNREVGVGVYNLIAGVHTLTRTPINSTNSNGAISVTSNAEVFVTALSHDMFGSAGQVRANNQANVIFNIAPGARSHRIEICSAAHTSASATYLNIAASVDGGSTYAAQINVNHCAMTTSTLDVQTGGAGSVRAHHTSVTFVNAAGQGSISMVMSINGLEAGEQGIISYYGTISSGATVQYPIWGSMRIVSTNAVSNIAFSFNAGNVADGFFFYDARRPY